MKYLTTALCAGLAVLAAEPYAAAQDGVAHGGGRTLTIGDVITAARSRSPDAREAEANAEAADKSVNQAYSGYLPSLRADASGDRAYTHSYQPDFATGTFKGNPQATLGSNLRGTLSWTAWDFGRTTSAVGAAKANAAAAAAQHAATQNDVARQAANQFLAAVFDEELVANAKATLALRERHSNMSRALVASGLRPPIEEARARVESMLAQLEVTKAEQQVAQDKVRLQALLTMDFSEGLKFVRPTVLPTLTSDARHAADLALRNRPEVSAANSRVTAQEESLDGAKAGRMPTLGVSLEGQYRTLRSDDDSRTFPTRGFTAMITVGLPIFDWSVWGQIPVAHANVAAAESRKSATLARVQGQAREAAIALHTAAALVEQAKQARDLAAAAMVIIEARYAAGRDGPFDLFEAARKDNEARRETIRAEFALATATIDMLAATGRLNEIAR